MIAKNKKSRQNILFSLLLLFLLISLGSFLASSNFKTLKKRAELNARIEGLKKEVQVLDQKNKDLTSGISQSGTTEYLEKVAKEQLGLKKQGEEMVVINRKEGEPEKKAEAPTEKNWWQTILEKLGF